MSLAAIARPAAQHVRAFAARPAVRIVLLSIYYFTILLGLLLIYGKGDFSTPPFIYQGF